MRDSRLGQCAVHHVEIPCWWEDGFGGVGGGETNRGHSWTGFPTKPAFIDACSGPAGFLVSLLVREGGPAKAVQAIDGA